VQLGMNVTVLLRLHNVLRDGKIIIYGQKVMVWKEVVVAYFCVLIKKYWTDRRKSPKFQPERQ